MVKKLNVCEITNFGFRVTKMQFKVIFLISFLFSGFALAKLDPHSEIASKELSHNGDIQRCYSESESGRSKIKQAAIINVRLKKNGTPEVVSVTDQTQDLYLKTCIEKIIKTLRFPVQAKHQTDLQLLLMFP